MTTHYATIKAEFHCVPVTVVMGQPNTHKTLLGGLHKQDIYQELSAAKMSELLGRSSFFVYNDPDNAHVLNK